MEYSYNPFTQPNTPITCASLAVPLQDSEAYDKNQHSVKRYAKQLKFLPPYRSARLQQSYQVYIEESVSIGTP